MPSSSPSPFTPLPHALVESIFTYSFQHPDHRGLTQRPSIVPPELKNLALVSREWNEYARDVASAATLRKLLVEDAKLKTRRDVVEFRRRVTLRRAFLRELELKDGFNRSTAVDTLPLDHWRIVFSHMPQLQKLDLKWLGRNDVTRLARIVQATRESCPQLKSLVMPTLAPTRTGRAAESPKDTQTLIDATLAGTNTTSLCELRLGVPTVQNPARHEFATQYLTRICDVHPDLEEFAGYLDLLDQMDKLTCAEQWFITPATWEKFCSTLTKLKTFDWIVAPFATPFFEIFGRNPKPLLEKLVFSTPMNWDWDQYRVDLGIPHALEGYGASARNAHAALKACPNLRALEVAIYLPGDGGDGIDEGFEWDIYDGFRTNEQQQQVPDTPMMNQEIFGDDFVEAVAKHCKKLEKFTVWRVLEASTVNHTVMTFTDRAMHALATLPRLRWAELKSVNITGDGLFSLAACFGRDSEHVTLQREFEITVGDDKDTPTEKAFYEIVEGFLNKLLACEPENLVCATRRVALRLHNGCFARVDREWSEGYLVRVRELASAVIAKHPSLRLRLLARGYYRASGATPASCDEIIEFGFYTVHTTVNEWWGWENESQDVRIDDVVLNRGELATKNRRAMPDHTTGTLSEDEDDDEEFYDDDEYGYHERGDLDDDY